MNRTQMAMERFDTACREIDVITELITPHLKPALEIRKSLILAQVPFEDERWVYYADAEWVKKAKENGFEKIVGLRLVGRAA